MVVLGLVTTQRGELEGPDVLKRRIEQAAKFVPLDQLCLSPQCGFSSTVEGNVLSYEQEVAKLERTLPLFKKYGEMYNFDYVFLTALAYQESRLVQNLRSRAGAVGVMQVIPSTAAAPPIGIKNIQNLENNIHAGTKYLDHIIEVYLSNDGLPRREQAIFAAASYESAIGKFCAIWFQFYQR